MGCWKDWAAREDEEKGADQKGGNEAGEGAITGADVAVGGWAGALSPPPQEIIPNSVALRIVISSSLPNFINSCS